VSTTYLQRLPGAERLGRASLPLHPHAFGRLDLAGYDVVISSSAFFSKCARVPPGTAHVCLCYTPARFLWEFRDTHLTDRSGRLERALISAASPALRRADRRAAARVDRFVAISSFIQDLIHRHYGRTSVVIAPPVAVEQYRTDAPRGDFLVTAAALHPYKRIDHAIEAAGRLGLPLKVLGEGPDRERLATLAGPGVELLGWVDEGTKQALISRARAFVAPQVEDFGIAMVEALAAGTPVVAPARGGAVDIVDDGRTGALYDPADPDGLVAAVGRALALDVPRSALHAAATRFSEAAFSSAFREVVEDAVSGVRSTAGAGRSR
jgi:glycosyltransferase involved in cell wall biosynthesis